MKAFFTLQLILVSITYAYLYCDVYILYQHVYTKQFLALTLKRWLHYLLIPGTPVTLRADRKINQNTELGLIDQIIAKMHNRSSCGQQWHSHSPTHFSWIPFYKPHMNQRFLTCFHPSSSLMQMLVCLSYALKHIYLRTESWSQLHTCKISWLELVILTW